MTKQYTVALNSATRFILIVCFRQITRKEGYGLFRLKLFTVYSKSTLRPGVSCKRSKLAAILVLMRRREDLRRQLLQRRKCRSTTNPVKVNNSNCAVINHLLRNTDSVAILQFKMELH